MKSGEKGFTLLELIVIIFILSLMTALSVPSFSAIGGNRIDSDTKKLASIVRHLNDRAITSKELSQLKVDLGQRLLTYKGPDGERQETMSTLSSINLQTRGELSEGEVIIFFNPTGETEAFSFILKDGEKVLTVSFNPLSGRVKII